jgi:hypothetical protein
MSRSACSRGLYSSWYFGTLSVMVCPPGEGLSGAGGGEVNGGRQARPWQPVADQRPSRAERRRTSLPARNKPLQLSPRDHPV